VELVTLLEMRVAQLNGRSSRARLAVLPILFRRLRLARPAQAGREGYGRTSRQAARDPRLGHVPLPHS
jgi:hypothetical protein